MIPNTTRTHMNENENEVEVEVEVKTIIEQQQQQQQHPHPSPVFIATGVSFYSYTSRLCGGIFLISTRLCPSLLTK